METKNSKIIFWGTPNFSVLVLEEMEKCGITPDIIVTSPDKPKGRNLIQTPTPVKIWAENKKISVLQPTSLKEFSIGEENDIFILAAYGKIIPERIIKTPKKGILNIHPSLLPKFRGPSPIQSALLEGVEETGVSIMILDKEMDHGPILKTEKINLKNWNPTYLELEKKSAELGVKMLCEIIPNLINDKIKALPQDDSKATYCKKIEKKDGFIEPEIILGKELGLEKLLLAERKVRALNPDPGTFTIIPIRGKEVRIKITKAIISDDKFMPEKVIPEGKKEMAWESFLKGNPIL